MKTQREAETVFIREIAFETAFDSGECRAVREVLYHRRIEKAVGACSVHGEAKDVAAVKVAGAEIGDLRVETTSAEYCGAMESACGIAVGGGLDHASKFATQFRRNAGGVSLDGLLVVEIIGRRERRGAVVEQDRKSTRLNSSHT